MSIEPVQATQALLSGRPIEPGEPGPAPAGFGAMFAQGVARVDATVARVDQDMRLLASGAAPSLHETMMHLEEAKLSLQLLAQVRNRLLDAYQEVMRTQV